MSSVGFDVLKRAQYSKGFKASAGSISERAGYDDRFKLPYIKEGGSKVLSDIRVETEMRDNNSGMGGEELGDPYEGGESANPYLRSQPSFSNI